jgi:hypothetical protein
VFEHQVQGMVGGNAVKGIELGHLLSGNELFNQRIDIELQFPEVDVDPLDDPIIEFF